MASDIIQNQQDAELLMRFSKGDCAAAKALTSRLAPVVSLSLVAGPQGQAWRWLVLSVC